MKIIHLSDTHLGVGQNFVRFNRILDAILSIPDVGSGEYVVVHTGDLIDKQTPEYAEIGKSSLARLEAAGIPLLLVPGNHDYGTYYKIDQEQASKFRATLAGPIFHESPKEFPVVTNIGDCVFIGLDSSQAEFGIFSSMLAEGAIGSKQRARLSEILTEIDARLVRPKVIVYLHHHPFISGYSAMPDFGEPGFVKKYIALTVLKRICRLKDTYSFLQIIRDRIDILLFGHHHFGLNHEFEAKRYGFKVALDASSTTSTGMDIDRMTFRIINTDTFEIETRRIPL